jgi:hypothetical protein
MAIGAAKAIRLRSSASARLEESVDSSENITRMPGELREGKKEVEPRLLEAVYPKLRRIAAR